jgi:uncharacterized protein (DUF952 family)/FMN phosphatase YigB (HAD superfamily)
MQANSMQICPTIMPNLQIIESLTIANVLPLIDDDTWLLVDLDNTLFQASQALGHVNWLLDEVTKRIEQGMSREDAFHSMYPLWKKTQMITSVIPVEAGFIEAIKELQAKEIVVMGVTHRESFLISETLRQLHSLNIDFLISAPSKDSYVIEAKQKAHYFKGILFVDTFNEKGEIFNILMQKMKYKPKKIIFLDDKKKNVEEFAQSVTKQGIHCIGVHYTAIDQGPQIYSPEIAQLQLSLLDKILSNTQAQTLLYQPEDSSEKEKSPPSFPDYLYKIISISQWQASLQRNSVILSSFDDAFIHLATKEQTPKVVNKFWKSEDYVILKIIPHKLIGRLICETNPGGSTKYFHLYEGSIPLDSVIEANIVRRS